MLKREFYTRDALNVAKDLLGKVLVRKIGDTCLKGKIVEVEAYMGPVDKASHGYNNRRTKRTEVMFLEGGYSYVYLIYGMHHCLNIVTGKSEIPEAVLIRALEPLEGMEVMKINRGKNKQEILTNGPGKLCEALSITRGENNLDLTNGETLWIEDGEKAFEEISEDLKGEGHKVIKKQDFEIISCKRIGIEYAEEYKDKYWRFYIKGNSFVSKAAGPSNCER